MKKFLSLLLISFAMPAMAFHPLPWQIFFQYPATELMNDIIELHNFLMWIMLGIVVVVVALITYVCIRFSKRFNPNPAKFSHNVAIEIIWTLIPVLILCIIVVPTYKLLHKAEKIPPVEMTIKVVGYQWYWHYEYPDHGNFGFDSYMLQDKDLKAGDFRLLEVDNKIVIPENTTVRFLITAGDVLHSFAVPSFGIKTDAVPGRVNQTWARVFTRGVYYGQCSELCGVNHGYMPIKIEVVSKEEFEHWIEFAKQKYALNNLKNKLLLSKL